MPIEFDKPQILGRSKEEKPYEGSLYSDISLPIGGIRDSGLNGSTDKLEEMAYIKRIHLAT
jgi:hypothetical protein